MSGTILLVIGVVALFAAIVGGGIKIRDIEVGTVPSLWRQGMLGAFGVVVAALGLALMDDDNSSANAPENAVQQESDINASDENATSSNAVDENASDANAIDANATDENSADTSSENGAGTG